MVFRMQWMLMVFPMTSRIPGTVKTRRKFIRVIHTAWNLAIQKTFNRYSFMVKYAAVVAVSLYC
jgi:hypothetical protein